MRGKRPCKVDPSSKPTRCRTQRVGTNERERPLVPESGHGATSGASRVPMLAAVPGPPGIAYCAARFAESVFNAAAGAGRGDFGRRGARSKATRQTEPSPA